MPASPDDDSVERLESTTLCVPRRPRVMGFLVRSKVYDDWDQFYREVKGYFVIPKHPRGSPALEWNGKPAIEEPHQALDRELREIAAQRQENA